MPSGEAIHKVTGSKNSISMVGTDNNEQSMLPSYLPERDVIQYTVFGGEKPAVNNYSQGLLLEIGRDFAIGYGYGSPHPFHMIHIDIIGEQGRTQIANTNSKTLREKIDEYHGFKTTKVILKETKGGRVIHSYDGAGNNDKYEWKVASIGCQDGKCSNDVDLIKIDKDMEFVIMYVVPTLPSFVPGIIPPDATLIVAVGGS